MKFIRQMNNKNILMKINFYILLLLVIGFFSCGEYDTGQSLQPDSTADNKHEHDEIANKVTLTEIQYKTAGITLGSIEPRQISGTFQANGVLDVPPQQKVSISIPFGGFLKQTNLLQGMRVKRGQLLAVIENPDYVQMQQDYLEAKSQLEFAREDYHRQQELAKENVNARKTLQQALSSFNTLTARVAGLREKIKASGINFQAVEKGDIQSSINIYSPINGFVTKVNVNIGKFVNSADVLFEIVDTEHLHAELTVFEKDVPKLEVGQKLRFILGNDTHERSAKVYLIGREIAEDRTVRVHCHIDEEDIHLLPGMYLKAIVETGNKEVNALPQSAVVDYLGKKYIFVQRAEREFEMLPVYTGNSNNGYVEVEIPGDAGISKNSIVIKGAYDLLSTIKNKDSDEGH